MIWLWISIAYMLLAIFTAPHRYKLAPHASMNEPGASTIFMSFVWPLYYLFKLSEWLVTRDKSKSVSLRQRRADKKHEAMTKARKAMAEVEATRTEAFGAMRKELREFRTEAMANWTAQYVALGGRREEAEVVREYRQRADLEAAAERRGYERGRKDYERRY